FGSSMDVRSQRVSVQLCLKRLGQPYSKVLGGRQRFGHPLTAVFGGGRPARSRSHQYLVVVEVETGSGLGGLYSFLSSSVRSLLTGNTQLFLVDGVYFAISVFFASSSH